MDDIVERRVRLTNSFFRVVEMEDRQSGNRDIPLHMSHCTVVQDRVDAYGAGAAIDLGNNRFSVVENTLISYHSENADGIRLNDANVVQPDHFRIDGCYFRHSQTAAAANTNYALRISQVEDGTVENCTFELNEADTGAIGILGNNTQRIDVTNCHFYGLDLASRGATNCAIYILGDKNHIKISDCLFDGWEPNVAGGSERCIVIASGDHESFHVCNCSFESNGGFCVTVSAATSMNLIVLADNSVRVAEALGLGFDIEAVTRGVVTGNTMHMTTAASGGVFMGATAGDAVVSGNRLHNAVITASAAAVAYGFFGGGGPVNLNYLT